MIREAMIYAYRMTGVKTVRLLLGNWDLMITIQANFNMFSIN